MHTRIYVQRKMLWRQNETNPIAIKAPKHFYFLSRFRFFLNKWNTTAFPFSRVERIAKEIFGEMFLKNRLLVISIICRRHITTVAKFDPSCYYYYYVVETNMSTGP